MKKKFLAAFIAAVLVILCVPFLSGCRASVKYTLAEDGESYIVGFSGYAGSIKGELNIPEEHDGKPVTEIAFEGFRGTNITSVKIPSSVKTIGNAAFANCGKLERAEFAEGSAISEIPRGLFACSPQLSEVTGIPQTVKKVGILSFNECLRLKSLTLPSGVEEIGDNAFAESGIAQMELPAALKVIGKEAFDNCGDYETVNFPEGLIEIGERAFYRSGIKKAVLPDSVTKLDYGAFHTCEKLELAVVGSGIKEIKAGVFGYCPSLKEVYIPAYVKKIEGAHYENAKLYCGHAFHTCAALETVHYGGTAEEWTAVEIDYVERRENGVTYTNNALINARKHYNSAYSA